MNFSGKFGSATIIWYPASGSREFVVGSLNNVGNFGGYWSASLGSRNAYSLYFYSDGSVNPAGYGTRAFGCSVRCLQVID